MVVNQRIKEILSDLKIFRGYRISDEKSFCERVARQLGNLPEASSLMGEYDDIIEAAIEKEYERMKSVSNINININREVTPIVSSDDDIFKIFGTARTPNSQNKSNVNESSRVDTPIVPINIKDDKQKGKTVRVTPVVRPRVNTEMVDKGKEKKAIDEVDLKDTTFRVYDILNNMKNTGEKIILDDEEYFCKRVAKKVLEEVDDIDIVECGEYDKNIEKVIRNEYQGLIHGKWKFEEKEPLVKMNIDIENIDGINDMRLYAKDYLYKLMEVLGYSYDNKSDIIEKIIGLIEPSHYILIVNGKYEDYMKTLIISSSKEYETVLDSFRVNGRFASFTQEERLNMLLEASQMVKDMKNNQLLSNGNDLYQQINQIIDVVINKHYSKLKNDINTAKNIGLAAAAAVSPATVGAIYGISSLYKRGTAEADYKQLENIQGINQILHEEDSGRGRR